MARKIYKVVTDVEAKGGKKFTMRIGTAHEDADGTIRVYLDAIVNTATTYRLEVL